VPRATFTVTSARATAEPNRLPTDVTSIIGSGTSATVRVQESVGVDLERGGESVEERPLTACDAPTRLR
jgi:hypothetical protein